MPLHSPFKGENYCQCKCKNVHKGYIHADHICVYSFLSSKEPLWRKGN